MKMIHKPDCLISGAITQSLTYIGRQKGPQATCPEHPEPGTYDEASSYTRLGFKDVCL